MSEYDLIKKIQVKVFKIFIEFKKICDKHNLRYYLIGGSCLGTVRHQGFIPWDDDIDIGMPRPDYERFLKIAYSQLPDYLFLQNHDTDKEYIFNYSKIRDSRTTYIEISSQSQNINHGLFIDIFPLDGYQNNKIFDIKNTLLNARINCKYRKNKLKNLIVKVVMVLFAPTASIACDKRETLLKSIPYDQSMIIANYCGAWGTKEIMPKSYIGEGMESKFNGVNVLIPEKYDSYLTQLYGNYMEFPPEEKRITHHETVVIDLDNSYLKYV